MASLYYIMDWLVNEKRQHAIMTWSTLRTRHHSPVLLVNDRHTIYGLTGKPAIVIVNGHKIDLHDPKSFNTILRMII